jgi:hypothetical protein
VVTGRLLEEVRMYIRTRLNDVDIRAQLTENYLLEILQLAANANFQ